MTNPILANDSYKLSHRGQLPKNTTKMYSHLTPRFLHYLKEMCPDISNKVIVYGLQSTVDLVTERWQTEFFDKPWENIEKETLDILTPYLGWGAEDLLHFKDLHELGYLPLEFKGLPEGSHVEVNIPVLTIQNTHDDYAWLTNFIEPSILNTVFKPMTLATLGLELAKLRDQFFDLTVSDQSGKDFALHDFSYRGHSGHESASHTISAYLLYTKGTDTMSAIEFAKQYYKAESDIAGSIPACYPENTEVLTNNGFKLFEELEEQDLIAQYHEDKSISFTENRQYHEYDYDGDLINYFNPNKLSVDISVTSNHTMIGRSKTGNIIRDEAQVFNYSSSKNVIVSGETQSTIYNELSSYERLLIAFQADGSYSSRQSEYTGERTGCIPLRFSVKKERKKDRLIWILNQCGFEYTVNQHSDSYWSIRCSVPLNDRISKTFDWVELDKVSALWCKEFVEETSHWDGSVGKERYISYSSIIKENVDTLAAICALGGIKVITRKYNDVRVNRKPLYVLGAIQGIDELCGTTISKTTTPYKGKVRCVTVDTGMIIIRQNGKVIVCGNCEHSTATLNIQLYKDVLSYYDQAVAEDSTLTLEEIYKSIPDIDVSETVFVKGVSACLVVRDKLISQNSTELQIQLAIGETFSLVRFLLDVYPTGLFAYVADSYDYYRLITVIIPVLKDIILNREGKLICRPDSGSPVEVICGLGDVTIVDTNQKKYRGVAPFKVLVKEYSNTGSSLFYLTNQNKYYLVENLHDEFIIKEVSEEEAKGSIEILWDTFGGTVNSKGFKVLDPHIGLVYGDGMTYLRIKDIYTGLMDKGFASSNVCLACGAYLLAHLSRDHLGFAVKASYAEVNGKGCAVYKSPATDPSKASKAGLFKVVKTTEGYTLLDHVSNQEEKEGELKSFWKEGSFTSLTTFTEIKSRLPL